MKKYPVTPVSLIQKKAAKEKIVVLTAYDASMAAILDEVGVDVILVGDSVGNVVLGFENTVSVTMDHMLHHTQAVARSNPKALLVADMPFMSYHTSAQTAVENAGRLIQTGGAKAVKMESFDAHSLPFIQAVIEAGIPVMGHIGFTPQSVYRIGGYKIRGKKSDEAEGMLLLAKELEKLGVFSIVLEMVPRELAAFISSQLAIPTIGIGAGPDCDGQVLVTHDLLGYQTGVSPKFVKRYASLYDETKKAISEFKQDVINGRYPDEEHTY